MTLTYVYRPKNKYPHIVYANKDIRIDDFYTDVNPWCKENFGIYGKNWFCPIPRPHVAYQASYAFKNKINAMAFLLRWA